MISIPSKHPKKKRRIDQEHAGQEPVPGPSSEVLPLVAPQLIKRSSKDPNRGMYPSNKAKSRHNNISSSGFVKASGVVIKTPVTATATPVTATSKPVNATSTPVTATSTPVNATSKPVNATSTRVNATSTSKDNEVATCSSQGGSNGPPSTKTNCDTTKCSKKSLNKKRRANIPSSSSTTKITKYHKSSDSSQNGKTEMRKKRKVRPVPNQNSGTSEWNKNWHKKDEVLLESITDNEKFFNHYQDCYGLVENSTTEENSRDYFKNLPPHIIETILCQIPMLDLMSCRLVCSRWMDIIDNGKFMEWKKLYYRYKSGSIFITNEMQIKTMIAPQEYRSAENCITILIKYMGKMFNRLPCPDMYGLLLQNPHGELAEDIMMERFPEWTVNESRVWCQLTLAVLICETVWDVMEVYKSLFTSKSSCVRPDVHDALYCIATFLLYFRSVSQINCGLHYRVYHALYLLENSIPFCQREGRIRRIRNIPGEQSVQNDGKIENSSLTYEQIRILNHRFELNQKIKIIALAGTGKTTTLVHLARLYPEIKFLNLVFSKTVNEEAKKIFPPNVTCKTAHALAFQAVGRFLLHKLTSSLRPYDLIGLLFHNEDHIPIYSYANLVLNTITNFTNSKTTAMTLEHVPIIDVNQRAISYINRDRILLDAYKIWQKMIDETNDTRMTHDVYLKLYHLKQPKLKQFQCIMVDEAQDCNPVILDIVLSQTIPILFVGDPYQQIFNVRGAQNALQNINATHVYYLTKSFRFGPQISYIASCVMEIMLNVRNNTLVGSSEDSNLCANVSGQYAVIARSNVVLFNEALRMIVFKRLKPYEPTVILATFAGGVASYGFDQIFEIYNLKFPSKAEGEPKDKFISKFKTYPDLLNYAKLSEDADLTSKIELVNQHGHDITRFLDILKEKCNNPIELANVVFTTAHKSKGLEFDTVSLTDDFSHTSDSGFIGAAESSREEAHILYIAITRAKKCLLLPEKLTKLLHLAHEKFEYPVSSKALLKENPELKCIVCSTMFIPHTVLVMLRRKTVMASGREIPEGPLCMKCGSDPSMRPDVHMNGLIMYLDPTTDNSHRFMSKIVGPLPTDPPIIHDRFNEFDNADRVFVINLNIH